MGMYDMQSEIEGYTQIQLNIQPDKADDYDQLPGFHRQLYKPRDN